MINPPVGKSGTSGAPITVRALNDGQVFIDGQGVRTPFLSAGHSYWTFQGIDFGNSSGIVMYVNASGTATGLQFKRIVAYVSYGPTVPPSPAGNTHIWSIGDCVNCLFEDIAGFGKGRDTFVNGGQLSGGVVRRAWLRWTQHNEGAVAPIQACYLCTGVTTYEDLILTWAPEGLEPIPDTSTGLFYRDPAVAGDPTTYDRWRGVRVYSTRSISKPVNMAHIMFQRFMPGMTAIDLFVDARHQASNYATVLFGGAGGGTGDRITTVRLAGQVGAINEWPATNLNECIATAGATGPSLGGCPNFYTGTSPGTGSRACFQYSGGALTQTPLWPWPMDDRIKAALARAGATGLAGTAGPGYAAGTVTSEIVSRYGAIPAQCLNPWQTPSVPQSVRLSSNGLFRVGSVAE